MAETIANALELYLVVGFSFEPTQTAPYVTHRRSCAYHPQGINRYSALDGTKHFKILTFRT